MVSRRRALLPVCFTKKFLACKRLMSTKEPKKNSRRALKKPELLKEAQSPDPDYEKRLRRRVEDRIRKDREALFLVARVLNIE